MSNIKVAVRCRPLFEQERSAAGLDIQSRRILLDSRTYDPDFTFAPTATQDDVFAACQPILQSVKDGLNGTLMVYGQTGTGKTFTMLGNDGEDNGLVHKVIANMLAHVQQKTLEGAQCALTLSMIEIYNERLTDMLSPGGDTEVTLIGGFPRFSNKVTLCRLHDANEAVGRGLAWRHTAATLMNQRSSRSHVVFILDLAEHNVFTEQTDVAHFFLVDLAGSESLKKSQASGSTAEEAGKINRSLLALKSVFLALSNTNEATRPGHVPYRDSRLTELLQDSIGGTARTLMIACISAVGRDIEETKSTLMYAVKARSIRNAANTEREKLQIRLRSMEVENQRLRNRLTERVSERGGYYVTKEDHERYENMKAENDELREDVRLFEKNTQSSSARQHIAESQTATLLGLVMDKEEELQKFKLLYYEAFRRFEHHTLALQRLVSDGISEVKRMVQDDTHTSHAKLQAWRASMVQLLGSSCEELQQPCPATNGEDTAVAPTLPLTTSPTPSSLGQPMLPPPSSVNTAIVTLPSARGSQVTSQRNSLPTLPPSIGPAAPQQRSPGRKTTRRGRGGASSLPAAPPATTGALCGEEAVSSLPPAARRLELLPTSAAATNEEPDAPLFIPTGARLEDGPQVDTSFVQRADADCQRIVDRINGTVRDLVSEIQEAYGQCLEATERIRSARRHRMEGVCAEMRKQVETHIEQLLRLDRSSTEDTRSAQDNFTGCLRMFTRFPDPADCHILQQVVRNSCAAAIETAEQHFPSAAVGAGVSDSLDALCQIHRRQAADMAVTELERLGNMASSPAEVPQPPFLTLSQSGSPRLPLLPNDMPPFVPSSTTSHSVPRSAPPSPTPCSALRSGGSAKENNHRATTGSPTSKPEETAGGGVTHNRISLRSSNGSVLSSRGVSASTGGGACALAKRPRSTHASASGNTEGEHRPTMARLERRKFR